MEMDVTLVECWTNCNDGYKLTLKTGRQQTLCSLDQPPQQRAGRVGGDGVV